MPNPSIYLDRVTKELSRLPGIGSKSASRIAFYLLKLDKNEVESIASSLVDLKNNIRACSRCGGISDTELCAICSDTGRDKNVLCVVEEARDILNIEASNEFRGLYHVLSGLISPLDGIGPEDLNIASLVNKCSAGLTEVILALNPTIEGDATALYLASLISPLGVKVTRIAHGLPVGCDLEFIDSATIAKSIQGRVRI